MIVEAALQEYEMALNSLYSSRIEVAKEEFKAFLEELEEF